MLELFFYSFYLVELVPFLFDFSYFENFQKWWRIFRETWTNPTWLNENQDLLSAISILIAIIPFYGFVIVKILTWQKDRTQKIVQSARSLYILGSVFFSLKREIKKFLEIINKNQQEKKLHEFSKLPILLKSYSLIYYLKGGIIDIFDEKQEKIGFETGIIDITDKIEIINRCQSNYIYLPENLEMVQQIIIQIVSIGEIINFLLPKLEKTIQKQNPSFKFLTEVYFTSIFSAEELAF